VHPPSTIETVLHGLAEQSATGCLLVRDPEGDEAQVYLREGGIYAVNVPGRRAMLGVRLVSSGALRPEALAEALEVQRTELEAWRLGELLIHLGYVEPSVVEASVVDHMTDALADLVGRPMASWRFRKRKKTRQDTGPRTLVRTLFDDLRDRARAWDAVLAVIGSAQTTPALASAATNQTSLEANERSLLSKVNGRRSIAEIAGECGFTLFEAGQVVVRLLQAQLIELEGPAHTENSGGVGAVQVDVSADAAEAERRAAEDKKRAAAEREAEARRKAEAKAREESDRRRVAAEHRRTQADLQAALELQRVAAARKQEQAERIRAAAAEREEVLERRRKLLEEQRLDEAQVLHRELEELAANNEAAERAATLETTRQAAAVAQLHDEGQREKDTQMRAAAERARLAADEITRLAQAAAELAVGEEAERIIREDAEQRAHTAGQNDRHSDDDQLVHKAMLAAQASIVLSQLSQGAGEVAALVPARAEAVEQVVEPPVDPQPPCADLDAPEARQNDTAMLLRELSSLNFDGYDRPGSSGAPPTDSTPAPLVPDPPPVPALPREIKKKKRLFNR
jgi:chemotaxis protein histidine kinase CheA